MNKLSVNLESLDLLSFFIRYIYSKYWFEKIKQILNDANEKKLNIKDILNKVRIACFEQ